MPPTVRKHVERFFKSPGWVRFQDDLLGPRVVIPVVVWSTCRVAEYMKIYENLERQDPRWETYSNNHKVLVIFTTWVKRLGKWKYQPLESLEVGDLFLSPYESKRGSGGYHTNIVIEKTGEMVSHKNLETQVIVRMAPTEINEFPIVIKLLDKGRWK